MNTYTLKVIEIRRETDDAITICFKQPGLKKIKYLPGQYITLILRIGGRRYMRPYSFSSAPFVDTHLEITVKRVVDGIVSNYIHNEIKVGDNIEVLQPMGNFVFNESYSFKNVFLWGVGSGITPLISIIKSILSQYSNVNINLVYGNKKIVSTIFWNKLLDLEIEYKVRFKVWHFHTISEENKNIIQGRIKPEIVLVNFNSAIIQNSLHFICGPPDLKQMIKKVLIENKVKQEVIKVEDFKKDIDIEELRDLKNRFVQVKYSDKIIVLEVPKGKSILDSALDACIELPYSCQTGNCSTCKGVLKTGMLKILGLKGIREDLRPYEYLMCCSFPLTDNVTVEI
jgi:ring-1,2-phenylacetyl-CoA epoxidase subunit PaaE